MKSVAQLLAGASIGATSAARPVQALPPEVRRFRVRLSRIAFYDVEVLAESASAAMLIAETAPPEKPKLDFYTALTAHRAKVWQPWDGGKWVDAPRE